MSMLISEYVTGFVQSIEEYFGTWRGTGAKREIAVWLQDKNLKHQTLVNLYVYIRDNYSITPTNVIGIVEIRKSLLDMPKPKRVQVTDGNKQMQEHLDELFRKSAAKANINKTED